MFLPVRACRVGLVARCWVSLLVVVVGRVRVLFAIFQQAMRNSKIPSQQKNGKVFFSRCFQIIQLKYKEFQQHNKVKQQQKKNVWTYMTCVKRVVFLLWALHAALSK